jgi:hypothetical protein
MGIFLFNAASRTVLGPTQPPIQWVPGALSLGVKRPRREADHSSPSSAEVKNAWSYTFTPHYVFMAWCLVKHRDNFTFTFYPSVLDLFGAWGTINTRVPPFRAKYSWLFNNRNCRVHGHGSELMPFAILLSARQHDASGSEFVFVSCIRK